MHRQVVDGGAIQRNRTGIVFDEANNHIKTGGFAGAVWAKQTYDFTAFNLERNRFDDLPFFVGLGEIISQ